jgi:hypothetical protein
MYSGDAVMVAIAAGAVMRAVVKLFPRVSDSLSEGIL